jgi:VWFA-related protein
MTIFKLAVISALSLAAACQDVTFQAGARLMEMQVVVSGKDGKPVLDLTKDDFTLLDGGKPRTIAFFLAPAKPAETAPRAGALPAGLFSNRPEYAPAAPQSVTCVLMDDLNSGVEERTLIRAQVMQFLRSYNGRDPIALYTLRTRLAVVRDFTDDPAALIEKAKALRVDMVVGSSESVGDLRREAQAVQVLMAQAMGAPAPDVSADLSSMEQLGRRLAGVPGRKNLVWIGNGMALTTAAGMTQVEGTASPALRSYGAEYARAARAMNDAGLAVYPVDAKGLAGWTPAMAAGALPGRRSGSLAVSQAMLTSTTQDTLSGMRAFAEATGGVVTRNSNDLAAGIRGALEDAKVSYTLAFYAAEESTQERALQLKLRGAGLQARYRKSYIPAPAGRAAELSATGVQELLSSPIAPAAILLNARVERDGRTLRVLLRIEPNNVSMTKQGGKTTGELMVWLAQKQSDGRFSSTSGKMEFQLDEQQWAKAQAGGLVLTQEVAAAPDAVVLRIAVRDLRSGATGALDAAVSRIP